MKMKNIITFTGAVILILVSSSCNKDYLEKAPLDAISDLTFWETKEDVAMAVSGCYSKMPGSFQDARRAYLDGLADGAMVYWSIYGIEMMQLGILSPVSGGAPSVVTI